MKLLIIIPILLTTLSSFGQTCDTIDGQQMNCIDINGLKQGYWKERKKVLVSSSYSGYGSIEGCQKKEEYRYLTKAEGQYKDNKKTGKWKFYSGYDHFIALEKEITFEVDGAVKEEDFSYYSMIEFNKDTSLITGYVYHNKDIISLNCINEKCTFKINQNKEILTFDFTDYYKFDYELLRLKMGMYDRIINEIKTNR